MSESIGTIFPSSMVQSSKTAFMRTPIIFHHPFVFCKNTREPLFSFAVPRAVKNAAATINPLRMMKHQSQIGEGSSKASITEQLEKSIKKVNVDRIKERLDAVMLETM
ncbi:hypothetical protein V2J09_011555 [Rumex salicifolius]